MVHISRLLFDVCITIAMEKKSCLCLGKIICLKKSKLRDVKRQSRIIYHDKNKLLHMTMTLTKNAHLTLGNNGWIQEKH